ASLGGVAVSDSRYIRDAILQRGRGAAANETEGRGVNAWASGVFGNGEFDGDNELAGYRADSTGYLAGLEKEWSGRAHLGLAVGETRTEITTNSLRSSGTARSQHIGLYGGMNAGAFALRVGGSWIDANLRTNRTAALNQFNNQLTGHYDGKGWQAYGEIAWRASFGASTIEPYANYTRVDYHADVAEVGGDAALSGRVEQVADLVTAGFRTQTVLSEGAGRPTLTAVTHLAWSHDFNDDGPEFRAKFADGPIFQVAGANIGQDALLTGLGVNIQANDRTNVEVGYAGVYQDDYNDNKLFARLNVKF
ncbi:autotransporter outer membrane beta-barrel domain-containing protein, partial [Brevundimonas sp.]|uniref:autotransporter outer membrane beta-barrel domain-containing protein n=1 Tax=Brevundimonas sp. TaxID=1871086 RepID=UPI0025BE4BB6